MKVNVEAPQKKHQKTHEKNAKLFVLRLHWMAVLVPARRGNRERLSRLNRISTCLMPPSSGIFSVFSQHNKNPFWRKGMSLGESRRRFIAFTFFFF